MTAHSVRPTRPQVSIIMPTFNRAQLIGRAIDSIRAQAFQDWELIIIDDGSVDSTADVVAPYLELDARIRYLPQTNQGPGFSRNVGMQVATGHYLTFLDSDDAYLAGHLESRIEYMERHPELELIQGGFVIVGSRWAVDYDHPERRIDMYDCVVGATFFGKREAFLRTGGYKKLWHCEDTEFWRRAAELLKVDRYAPLPRTYVYFRQEQSITGEALAQLGSKEPLSVPSAQAGRSVSLAAR